MKTKNSKELFKKSKEHIAGGVNSPVRAFKSVGGTPIFFKKSRGCYLYDEDGNKYLDFVGSWGPMVLGHSNKAIVNAIKRQASKAISFGALLVKAGSGAATLGVPDSPGIPDELSKLTITLEYNNASELKKAFTKFGEDIAAVIVEPIAGNMGFIEPDENFLKTLRSLCTKNKSILIFDEVMTGFRVARGGVQELFNIKPDLTALGKIVGGGLPVGVYGGKAKIMNNISPDGPVYQAGTLSGNPVAVSAGSALLKQLKNKKMFSELERKGEIFLKGLKEEAEKNGIPFCYNIRGGMFGFFFSNKLPKNFQEVSDTNISMFNKFFRLMLEQNVYLPPSAFESCFLSTEHTQEQLMKTVKLSSNVFKNLNNG